MPTLSRGRAAASLLFATLYAAPALGQEGSATTGFPLGEKSRLHVELAAGVAYDSNPSRNDEDIGGPADGDGKLLIRPGLDLNVPGSVIRLGLGAHASFFQFFGLDEGNSRRNTQIGADANLNLNIGSKRSVVGFSLSDTFIRTPTYFDQAGTVAADEIKLKSWNNIGVARLTLRPGGGALEFDLGYRNNLNIYDADQLSTTMQHGGLFEARYKFLPKTAAVFHADFTTFGTLGAATGPPTNPSTPYNITLGLVGQITSKISLDVAAGFGDTLTWQGSTFSDLAPTNKRTFIASVLGRYQFNESSYVSLGYNRALIPIVQLDNYTSNAVRAQLQLGFGRLEVNSVVAFENRGYGVDSRSVNLFVADAGVGYWFFDFLKASANYRFLLQAADDNTGGTASILLEDYTRHQAFLNVTLRY